MKEKFLFACDREAKHYEGLELREGASCIVRLSNLNLQICDAKRQQILNISLKSITNVGIISDKELIEKDRNVIGRGIAGGLLFGGAGLILGGLSGVAKKQVEQNIDYLVINYKSNNEDKVINLYAKEGVFDRYFMQCLNRNAGLIKKEFKCPKCGNVYNIGDINCLGCGKQLRNTKAEKVVIGILCFLLIIVVSLVFAGIVLSISKGNNYNKDVEIIKKNIIVDEVHAENIDKILDNVGIKEFESIEADEWLDGYEGEKSKGYRIKTDFSDNVIMYLDSENNVVCIRFADEDYYRNGNILKKFEN